MSVAEGPARLGEIVAPGSTVGRGPALVPWVGARVKVVCLGLRVGGGAAAGARGKAVGLRLKSGGRVASGGRVVAPAVMSCVGWCDSGASKEAGEGRRRGRGGEGIAVTDLAVTAAGLVIEGPSVAAGFGVDGVVATGAKVGLRGEGVTPTGSDSGGFAVPRAAGECQGLA